MKLQKESCFIASDSVTLRDSIEKVVADGNKSKSTLKVNLRNMRAEFESAKAEVKLVKDYTLQGWINYATGYESPAYEKLNSLGDFKCFVPTEGDAPMAGASKGMASTDKQSWGDYFYSSSVYLSISKLCGNWYSSVNPK